MTAHPILAQPGLGGEGTAGMGRLNRSWRRCEQERDFSSVPTRNVIPFLAHHVRGRRRLRQKAQG